ncbi:hypothetical protein GYH30_050000 [Glycine max]|uniref:Uncharacterized protein n=1 Tax=Glycine max TaxID=3847 RepID=A0A0R0F039_SOYBN|nr:hypothetical protein GYH30_050000 [Glycine max]
MFPFLAFGHIKAFVQLSNKLFSHGVRITFLLADIEGRNITFEDLKKPPPGYPRNYNIFLKAFEAMYLMFFFKRFDEKNFTGSERVLQGFSVCSLIVFRWQPSMDVLEEKWSKWLDSFPAKSVILCSFGTELERALPKRFLERVKNRGVAHTGWFQQHLVLKHSSVECHIGHGGFNSVIEALASDCELVLLPFKAGIEVNYRSEDVDFKKEDILKAVKTIMVEDDKELGKQIKENHMKWKEFLSNKGIQNKFITGLVAQLKAMA